MSKKKQDQREQEEIEQEEQETGASDSGEDANDQSDTQDNKLRNQLAEEKDKFLRLAAEYDNYRKRTLKEREGVYTDAQIDTVTQFLPIYDNLERALSQETADKAFYKGVEMIMTGFKEILDKLGVEEIPALGETFDPQLHNAIMHIEDDSKKPCEIVEELQKGFKIKDKIIRFSLVKVAN